MVCCCGILAEEVGYFDQVILCFPQFLKGSSENEATEGAGVQRYLKPKHPTVKTRTHHFTLPELFQTK
jgi:hypothetical protein